MKRSPKETPIAKTLCILESAMRQIALFALLLAGISGIASAQIKKDELKTGNAQSPEAETAVTIAGKQVWVFYHAPSVKGRKMFGSPTALQPEGSVWRMGADYATILHTDGDLVFKGLTLPKGDYALYIALNKGQWDLIINKTLMAANGKHLWGINMDGTTTNNPATEVGRVAMTMSKPTAPTETLKIDLTSSGGAAGTLGVKFENVTASVPFTVK